MLLGTFQQLAVYTDVIVLGIGFGAQLGDGLSVHGNSAGGDQLFGLTARSNPGGGNNFL